MKSSSETSLASAFVPEPLCPGGREFVSIHTPRAPHPSLESRLQAAYEEGRQAGRAELPWADAERLGRAASALSDALHEIEKESRELRRSARELALELGLAIAERLVAGAVAADLDALAARVDAALQLVEGPTPPEVHLATDDHATVTAGAAPELQRLAEAHGARFSPDPELAPGQVRVIRADHRVELDLSRTLERLGRDLRGLLDLEAAAGANGTEPGNESEETP